MRWLLLLTLLLFAFTGRAHAQINTGCTEGVLVWTPINTATGATKTLIAGVAGKKIYVCKLYLQTTLASNVAIVEGTGTDCGTAVTAGLFGGATAATGFIMPANGQVALNGSGSAWGVTATAGDNLCIINSVSTQLSGVLVSVQQ